MPQTLVPRESKSVLLLLTIPVIPIYSHASKPTFLNKKRQSFPANCYLLIRHQPGKYKPHYPGRPTTNVVIPMLAKTTTRASKENIKTDITSFLLLFCNSRSFTSRSSKNATHSA